MNTLSSAPKTVSATEAKANLSSLMKLANQNQSGVVIQSHGNPQAAIISYDEYEKLLQLQEQIKRKQAIAHLESLAKEVQSRNKDLTADKADKIADEITRDAIDRLVSKKKIRFADAK